MPQLAIIAKIRSAPGKRAELATAFQEAFGHVENEPGTLTYILHEDTKDEDLLWFYETYTDQEALQAHGKSDWMKAMGPKLGPLMAGRAELTFLNPIGGKGI
jgi:quinol monooxygenase YgiN